MINNKYISRILKSSKDIQLTKELSEGKKIHTLEQPDNYLELVVIKPWGYEFLIYKNEHVAMWLLYIKKDHSTSMHSHPQKTTSLIILNGDALCNTFSTRNFLKSAEALLIEKGVFHSTKALSLEGIFVLEIETPPNKMDLLRLRDNYGRENFSYESKNQMRYDKLETFNHFYMDDKNPGKEYEVIKDKVSFLLHEKVDGELNLDSIYCLTQGAPCELTEKLKLGEINYGREIMDLKFLDHSNLLEIKFKGKK